MKKMLLACLPFLIMLGTIFFLSQNIKQLKKERDKYRTNTETMLQDIDMYKTKDSLNAVSVGVLQLSLDEYAKYRAEDLKLIESLKTNNRKLSNVTTSQMETINELKGMFRDSLAYMQGDTIVKLLRCIDIIQPWYELHGCQDEEGQFAGIHINRESLVIASTTKYKRFLGFLWYTNKVKNRKIDVVSKNPATKIIEIEYVELK